MKVIWTKFSEISLLEIVDYIEADFGVLVAEKYYWEVLETIDAIEINPELFPIYQNPTNTRKAVINKKQFYIIKL